MTWPSRGRACTLRRMRRAIEVYLATRKLPDQPWNRFVARPIGAVVVALLKDSRITPNQITLVSLVLALVAVGLLLAWPGYWGLVVAAIVYEASYVLDCADGMLARWRKTQSTVGHLLDFLMDELKAFLILAAVSVRLFLESSSPTPLLVGLFGLVALASGVALTTFLRRPELNPVRSANSPPAPRSLVRRAVGVVETLAKFIVHYPSYIWLAAAVGHIEAYFYPYVIVNALYAAVTMAALARRFGRFAV